MEIYKPEISLLDQKCELISNSQILSDDTVEASINLKQICELINASFSNQTADFANSIIENFMQFNEMLKTIKKKATNFPYQQIMIDYKIIPILFSLFQNIDNEEYRKGLLICMADISLFNDSIISHLFLTENFIEMFKEYFQYEPFTFHFFHIYYNLLKSIHDQETFNSIFLSLNVQFFFDIMREIDFEPDILNLIFMILSIYSAFQDPDSTDENAYYEIIAYYFFEERIYEYQDVLITTTFPRNCLQILANLISRDALNLECFDTFKLFEFLNHYLIYPPIENHSKICHIIYLLIAKYHCSYSFDIHPVLNVYLHEMTSIRSQYYSSSALNAIVQTDENYCALFFQNNCELLFKICDSFFSDICAKAKIAIAQLVLFLLSHADSEVWNIIFNFAVLTNISEMNESDFHMSMFTFVSDSLELCQEDEIMHNMCISFLLCYFDKAVQLGYQEQYLQFFWEIFDENNFNDKFKIDDPLLSEFMQKLGDK